MSLREYIRVHIVSLLDEATAYDRQARLNPSLPPIQKDPIVELETLFSSGSKFYVHFSELNKLGVFPASTESTGPWGIYAYELSSLLITQFKEGRIPFASDREFVHVFASRNNPRILDLQSYGTGDLKQDYAKFSALFEKAPTAPPEELKRFRRLAIHLARSSGSPGKAIWNITKAITEENLSIFNKEAPGALAKKWRTTFTTLGYDGVIDNGEGIIHSNEESQVVFFSPKFIQQVKVISNPIYKENQIASQFNSGEKAITNQAFDQYQNAKSSKLRVAVMFGAKSKQAYTEKDLLSIDIGKRIRAIEALNLDEDALENLYETDDDYQVRAAIVSKLPVDKMWKYAKSESESVRAAAAERAPIEDLKYFKDDYDTNVLFAVIKRSDDSNLISDIASNADHDSIIRMEALKRLDPVDTADLYADDNVDIRTIVAERIPLFKVYRAAINALLNDSESTEIRKIMKNRLRVKGHNPFRLETLPNS
jgi:hypothetical protein